MGRQGVTHATEARGTGSLELVCAVKETGSYHRGRYAVAYVAKEKLRTVSGTLVALVPAPGKQIQ